jgi:hypothetical protein
MALLAEAIKEAENRRNHAKAKWHKNTGIM